MSNSEKPLVSENISEWDLCTRGNDFYDQYTESEEGADVDSAIDCFDQALHLGEHSESHCSQWLFVIASTYQDRFDLNHDLDDLEKAVDLFEKNLDVNLDTADKDTQYNYLISFGNAAENMFYESADLSLLDKSIAAKEGALALCSPHDDESGETRLMLLDELADACTTQSQLSQECHGVDKAIMFYEEQLSILPKDEQKLCLSNLSSAFGLRFKLLNATGSIPDSASVKNDLDRCIETLDHLLSLHAEMEDQGAEAFHAAAYSMTVTRLAQRYNLVGTPEDLDRALMLAETASNLLPSDLTYNERLADLLIMKGQKDHDVMLLEKAVFLLQESILLPSIVSEDTEHPYKSLNLLSTAAVELARAHPSKMPLVDEVLNSLKLALPGCSSAQQVLCLKSICIIHFFKCDVSNFEELDQINNALQASEDLLTVIRKDDENYPNYLQNYAQALELRHRITKDLTDLQSQILILEELRGLQNNHHRTMKLCIALNNRFEACGDSSDLDTSITLFGSEFGNNMCLELAHTNRASCLYIMSSVFLQRFQERYQLSDFQDAVKLHTKSMQLTGSVAPFDSLLSKMEFTSFLNLLHTFRELFNENKIDIVHLDWLLKHLNETFESTRVIDIIPTSASLQALLLKCTSLMMKSEKVHNNNDILQALNISKDILFLYRRGDLVTPSMHLGFQHLAGSFYDTLLDEGTHALLQVDTVIELYNVALELANADTEHATILEYLGAAYQFRFRSTGELLDLDKSTDCLEKSLKLLPANQDATNVVDKMCQILVIRYSHSASQGSTEYLRKAIAMLLVNQKNLQGVDRSKSLCNVAAITLDLWGLEKKDIDWENATSYLREALELCPLEDPSRAIILNNLGMALQKKAEISQRTTESEIDQAIQVLLQSHYIFEESHNDRFSSLSLQNLASSFSLKFDISNNVSDIETAIHYSERAVAEASRGIVLRMAQLELVDYYLKSETYDVDFARQLALQVAMAEDVVITHRFQASLRCIEISTVRKPCFEAGITDYDLTINMLPLLFLVEVNPAVRLQVIKPAAKVVSDAAAWALQRGDIGTALKWLDRGRGLFWEHILQLNVNDFTFSQLNLPQNSMEKLVSLAQGLKEMSQSFLVQSQQAMVISQDVLMSGAETYKHRQLQKDWITLMEELKQTNGSVQNPWSYSSNSDFLGSLQDSLVVVLVASTHGCYGILNVPKRGLKHIHFSNVTVEILENMRQDMVETAATRSQRLGLGKRSQGPAKLEDILAKLWNLVGKPILSLCGIERSVNQEHQRPRIWWCPTSVFTFLPIHAAGLYYGNKPEGMMNFVISSYIPTLASLHRARERYQASTSSPTSKVLVIAQPYADGYDNIPFTLKEQKEIKDAVPPGFILSLNGMGELTDGRDATISNTLAQLPLASIVHFACHGVQAEDPLESGLLLYDGKLRLSDLIHMNLPHADVAYLSACESAAGDQILSDEAIHLGAGMMAAGFQSVVATMWPIGDIYAPVVARELYQRLYDPDSTRGCKGPKAKHTAAALHHAVMALRAANAPLTSWVPFIHLGI